MGLTRVHYLLECKDRVCSMNFYRYFLMVSLLEVAKEIELNLIHCQILFHRKDYLVLKKSFPRAVPKFLA